MNSAVKILILNWNGFSDTCECLDSCLEINYSDFEIFVLDNNSDNNEFQKLSEEYGDQNRITIFKSDTNLGFAGGNNYLINQAFSDPQTQYFVCLNNDTFVESDFIFKLIDKTKQGYDMVGPQIFQYQDRDKIDNFGLEITAGMLCFNRINPGAKLFGPSGCAVLYTRKFLKQTKLGDDYFDSSYFCYAEDWDLAWRGLLQGFKPAIVDTNVYHKGSASAGKMSDFTIYHTYRNSLWTILKNLPLDLLLRYIIKIKLAHWAIIIKNATRGQLWVILKAYLSSYKRIFQVLKQRKIIQKNNKISSSELKKYINPRIFSKDYF